MNPRTSMISALAEVWLAWILCIAARLTHSDCYQRKYPSKLVDVSVFVQIIGTSAWSVGVLPLRILSEISRYRLRCGMNCCHRLDHGCPRLRESATDSQADASWMPVC